MKIDKNLIKYFSDQTALKNMPRTGWRLAGVKFPESLAEHTCIAVQLAYIIGELEGLDGAKCAALLIFHDNGEIRINDQHKVAARYINAKNAEKIAFFEQTKNLPDKISKKIQKMFIEKEERTTPEGIVAQDADWLECAVQAKIYTEQGYNCIGWINNIEKALETKSAKKILKLIKEEKKFTTIWWQGLKKMTYKKLQ